MSSFLVYAMLKLKLSKYHPTISYIRSISLSILPNLYSLRACIYTSHFFLYISIYSLLTNLLLIKHPSTLVSSRVVALTPLIFTYSCSCFFQELVVFSNYLVSHNAANNFTWLSYFLLAHFWLHKV